MKDIVKKYTFTKEEMKALQNLEIGIIAQSAAVNGMQVMKSGLLKSIYQRLGIDGEPKKGYSKSIQYNLSANQIVHTQSPIKKGLAKK